MIITHSTLEPFFVDIEKDGNYTLKQRKPATEKRPKGSVITEGYFRDLESALKKVARLKAAEGDDTMELDAYILKLENLINSLAKIKK